jgi:xanthine dehydrogenase YagT iron-sulfur-binding subunit
MASDEQDAGPHEIKDRSFLGRFSRRSFIRRLGAAGAGVTAAAAVQPLISNTKAHTPDTAAPDSKTKIPGSILITLRVNGQQHQVEIDPRATLLDTLRETLHLTGTKKGCDHGQCGACTVHINGRRVNSCLTFASMHQAAEITTIEGLGQPGNLHPVQAAFVTHDGYQCGYCTAGQIMSAVALLKEPCGPSDADVKEALSGNICRCGAYSNIVAAVQQLRRTT